MYNPHKLRLDVIVFLVFTQAQRGMLFKVTYPISGRARSIRRFVYNATFQGTEGTETPESPNFSVSAKAILLGMKMGYVSSQDPSFLKQLFVPI